MTLILRTMKKHMGWDDAEDDYGILDGEKSVGRIYKEHGEAKWFWSVNTSPFPAPPPNNGLAKSLEEAKQQFKQRYEEMKAHGVRPFSDSLNVLDYLIPLRRKFLVASFRGPRAAHAPRNDVR